MDILVLIAIIAGIFVIFVLTYFTVTLYRKVPPNKALIITGLGGRRVVVGGGTIVFPLVQSAQELSLEARIIDIRSPQILTLDKVPLSVEAVATVKIDSSNQANILSAAERFLGKTDQEIDKNIKEILEGHTREVIAKTRLQQLLHDRDTFIQEVNKSAAKDLGILGLRIDAFTIKDVLDPIGSIKLALTSLIIDVTTAKILTADKIPVSVSATAAVKFNLNELEKAGERFLSQKSDTVIASIREILEGKTREVIAAVNLEELLHKREEIVKKVEEAIKDDFTKMGLILDTFAIKDIGDPEKAIEFRVAPQIKEQETQARMKQAELEKIAKNYELEQSLEIAKRQAETEKEKRIYTAQQDAEAKAKEAEQMAAARKAAAEAEAQAAEKEAEADQRKRIAQIEADMKVSEERRKAEAKRAEADMAYFITEKEKQIELQNLEAQRKEKELEATVKKPAEAERYKIEQLAEAERMRQIALAQAEAEKIKLSGQAEAEAAKAKGLAEAEVTEAQGVAIAKAMMKKAEAWRMYNNAAIAEIIIEKLPEIAEKVANPLNRVDKVIMIGGGNGAGFSNLTRDIAGTVATVPEVLKNITGVDLIEILKGLSSQQTPQTTTSTQLQQPSSQQAGQPKPPQIK
ncbi:MAG: SPFH domain-containing protein [Candidatus Calescibacterium sp.]|nr:SPFH domain-containing protein [Candidatus Calescibacterium sp.]MDW8195253.1 SPFH domain-containing protein [Candidatus Calescibacterium sp.]